MYTCNLIFFIVDFINDAITLKSWSIIHYSIKKLFISYFSKSYFRIHITDKLIYRLPSPTFIFIIIIIVINIIIIGTCIALYLSKYYVYTLNCNIIVNSLFSSSFYHFMHFHILSFLFYFICSFIYHFKLFIRAFTFLSMHLVIHFSFHRHIIHQFIILTYKLIHNEITYHPIHLISFICY